MRQENCTTRHHFFETTSDALLRSRTPLSSILTLKLATRLIDVTEDKHETSIVSKLSRPPGRLLCLDLGARRVGVAVSDEMQLTVRPLAAIDRTNWKKLLREVVALCDEFDAKALVIGLPLRLDGTKGVAACNALRLAHNFARSLSIPIALQDERLTTRAAAESLRASGVHGRARREKIDSYAAAEILQSFIAETNRIK